MNDRIGKLPASVTNGCGVERERCGDVGIEEPRANEKTDPVNLSKEINKLTAECKLALKDLKDFIRDNSLNGGPYSPADCIEAYLRGDDKRIKNFDMKKRLRYEALLCTLHAKYECLKVRRIQQKELEKKK